MTAIVYGDDAQPMPADAEEGRPIYDLSVSEDEINELLYGTAMSVEERVQRLELLRAELQGYEGSDLGGDAAAMLAEVEGTLAEIRESSDDLVNPVPSPEDLDGHGELMSLDDDARYDDDDEGDDVLDHDDEAILEEEQDEDDLDDEDDDDEADDGTFIDDEDV